MNATTNHAAIFSSAHSSVLAPVLFVSPANNNTRLVGRSLAKVTSADFAAWLDDMRLEANIKAEECEYDGGTSNTDVCAVTMRKTARFSAALDAAGIHWYHSRGSYSLSPMTSSQGERRTEICKTMASVLRLYGLDAWVDHHTD